MARVLIAAAFLLPVAPSQSYSDGPPPAHTGGFGEPTCRVCHAENPLNAPGGSLALSGLPAIYAPGTSYRVTVTLRRADLRRGGFQLAARFASGAQAGALRPLDSAVAVTIGPGGVSYAHQRRQGSVPARRDTASWVLEWIAPDSGEREVSFHLAGNAANNDASEFGDYIYTHTTIRIRPHGNERRRSVRPLRDGTPHRTYPLPPPAARAP